MKHKDITQKSDKELQTLLSDKRKELGQLAIDMKTKQIPNTKQVRSIKKTIARTLTVQRERQLKEENNG